MQIRIFTIPAYDGSGFEQEMNNFLKNHKILKIESSLIAQEHNAAWSFCVHYTEGQPAHYPAQKEKIDYKDLLSPEAFARFLVLRRVRKQISGEEGVPPFQLYNDKQMAEIAKMEDLTAQKMSGISGIGEKKIERFSEKIITLFNKLMQDEKSRTSD